MRTVIERYYDQYYAIDIAGKENNDQYINKHSNGVCVVGLAPTHPALTKSMVKIEYTGDLENNQTQGTQKKGAFKLHRDTIVAYITCDDNSTYPIYSCVKGKLLETNKTITQNIDILKNNYSTSGYIIIVEPFETDELSKQSELLSFEKYHQVRGLEIVKGPKFLKDITEDEE
ncbi:hypothetical protein PPL_09485 [Heterostelium album PN500]|uniref:Protein Abitram n=1 Tax=Heterostelium pallidum (strain ATCC 26659 / Pp 5 / PN500) TaxID=670386 RepID=D3BN74_HETP5|nr:hypothetical protein PPL_09485 [Heterostelium album PN500]EFA76734.1 hypothetical protein PPL_09485 [Heterostelium album PN500]|eukprot:XP_020428866.1 hypothetical protein PPL_09485 [Heterostelium album PN500]